MSLTINDFLEMVRQTRASANIPFHARVARQVNATYGHVLNRAHLRGQLLSEAGVAAYNTVKTWIAGGCKTELARSEFRGADLYMGRAPLRVADRRKRIDDVASYVGVYTKPTTQLDLIRQNATVLLLRKALLNIADNRTTPAETKQYIGDTLLACQAELRILVNA